MNVRKLIQEDDENKTLFENHCKSQCIVIFGKVKNRGRLKLLLKNFLKIN